MTTQLGKPFDVQEYLRNEEPDLQGFLRACVADDPGDGSLVRRALAEIAKLRGLTELAKKTGISRRRLRRALAPDANSRFETIFKISRALQAGPASDSLALPVD